jgi:hypothetical protein
VLFETGLDTLAEERAVGQNDGGAAGGLEQANDQGEEEVGGLAGAEVRGEVRLDAVFLAAAEGWIGEDDVDAVAGGVADVGPGERVVVAGRSWGRRRCAGACW